jgi:hypothetical protein
MVQFAEAGCAPHLFLGNAVNGDIVRVEVIARVNEPHFGINFLTVLERDNANLANATHARICGF